MDVPVLMFLLRMLLLAGALLALAPPPAHAALKIEGTRLIYFGQDRDASISVVNQANREMVVQTWITGDAPDDRTVLFAATEPLVKLGAGEHHKLRILYAGEGLPSDRESLLWLNIMEIPRKPESPNAVQFAIRQRLKLLYRPPTLKGGSAEALPQLIWRSDGGQSVTVSNPSAFHLSLVDVHTDTQVLSDYLLLKPRESKTLAAPRPLSAGATLHFTNINDIGLQTRHSAALK